MSASFAVVLPFRDEAAGISATLAALAGQTDRGFRLVAVDNASTDGGGDIVRTFAATQPWLDVEVVHEPAKGTGRAADTGVRHAIAGGATRIARTDADCIPAPTWVAACKRALDDGIELVCGRIVARTDEGPASLVERVVPAVVAGAALFGRLRPGNRGPAYRCPYVMAAGNNMAFTAALYETAGGFPRTAIEELHEDRALVNAARLVTDRVGRRRDVVVANSVRRLRAWGLRATLLWYYDHRVRRPVVDVR